MEIEINATKNTEGKVRSTVNEDLKTNFLCR